MEWSNISSLHHPHKQEMHLRNLSLAMAHVSCYSLQGLPHKVEQKRVLSRSHKIFPVHDSAHTRTLSFEFLRPYSRMFLNMMTIRLPSIELDKVPDYSLEWTPVLAFRMKTRKNVIKFIVKGFFLLNQSVILCY